ncbi:uncharacterized protein PAC_18732 [Phialocephala subalpina]|uniref:Heterokaryon incompatibility domain-containing protein n=1 Tax=Phialocephala subalpina TaxID=576137 RepID=A0A1L7XUX4_9HELO|nr:uncharacterized protein PAC_18732 [Phialocephala subalpina]
MDVNRLNLEDRTSLPSSSPNDNGDENEVNFTPGTTNPNSTIDYLCERCKEINFDEVLYGERKPLQWSGEKQDVIERLGPVENWDTDSCALCKALFNLIPMKIREKPLDTYALQSFSSEQATIEMYGPDVADHYPLLADLPRRVILQMRDTEAIESSFKALIPQTGGENFVRILNPAIVDYDVLRGWLSVCLSIHTNICSSKYRTTVQYLKVLDCETRKLVSADNLPYITLSYMWGANERPPLYTEQLGHGLPPTIEDSITVTLKLGYRYLWIDRYCINQQNNEQAMSQIQQMDSIYKDSEVTIVAAAGVGPGYGLPGVSRPRRPQSIVNLGQLQLINPGSIAREVLRESRWSTRGWTFQEAYLSKRRIIFTDEQVYYECSGMYSYESLNVPLRKMHAEEGQILDKKYIYNLDGRNTDGKIVVFPGGVGHEPLHIFDRIIDFSVKSLTYTSDKLSGFLGIAKAFEKGPHRIRNLWGSPILPKPAEQSTPASYHVTEFLSSMVWLYGEAERVPSFPSWSWVGWDGDLFFSSMGNFYGLDQAPATTVSIELVEGEILPWDTFHEQYAKVNSLTNISQYIHISGWAVPITILKRNGLSCRTQLSFRDGCYLSWKFDQHDSRFTGDTCTGLLTVDNRDPNLDRMIFMLLVAKVDGKMERVGGSWLPLDSILYDESGEPVLRKGQKYGEKFAKWDDLVERYGEVWYGELVSSYETVRLG